MMTMLTMAMTREVMGEENVDNNNDTDDTDDTDDTEQK